MLSSIGVFIGTYLTLSHYMVREVACGGSDGCSDVLTSQYAMAFGAPVALWGLLGYLILFGLGVMRAAGDPKQRLLFAKAGLVVASFGLAASAYFMYVSFDMIRETCKWCVSSAILMLLLFVAHLFLSQVEDIAPRPRRTELPYMAAFAVLLLAALGFRLADSHKGHGMTTVGALKLKDVPDSIEALIPPNAHVLGDNKAHVTIVEFGDLLCPHCKKSYAIFTKVVQASGGDVRFVFRHFPLMHTQGHELALTAAMISELAAEKGHFWDFLDEIYSVDDGSKLTMSDLYNDAERVGVTKDEVESRLPDDKDRIYTAVSRDMKEAGGYGVRSTPTLIVACDKSRPVVGQKDEIEDLLRQPPYNKYVKGLVDPDR